MIAAIWAQGENGLIGNQGGLPWHLPADLQFFREKTLQQTLVMGRKTFEGMGGKALPQRKTILLTRQNLVISQPNVTVVKDIDEILKLGESRDLYIAGGGEIYQLFEPFYTLLYRTVIKGDFKGDTYFPDLDFSPFELVSEKIGQVDEKNPYPHRFETWHRKP